MRFVASIANANGRPTHREGRHCEERSDEAIQEPQGATGLLRSARNDGLCERTLYKLPPLVPGLRIGLFGGSFNPPHDGHRAASLLALRRLRLDRIWWLVTPNNPLKDARELAPLDLRLEGARKLAKHPRIKVTAIEAAIGATFSFETISYLKERCPGIRFVWIMGADNFRDFDRWQRWRGIAKLVPIAVVDRPGFTLTAFGGRAATTLAAYRRSEACAPVLALATPPAFIFLHGPRSDVSSTELRGKPYLPDGVPDSLQLRQTPHDSHES